MSGKYSVVEAWDNKTFDCGYEEHEHKTYHDGGGVEKAKAWVRKNHPKLKAAAAKKGRKNWSIAVLDFNGRCFFRLK